MTAVPGRLLRLRKRIGVQQRRPDPGFQHRSSDKLDIRDLLSGYDYGADDISEWVQITDNGTDSTLSIDADGGANNFVAVAAIWA